MRTLHAGAVSGHGVQMDKCNEETLREAQTRIDVCRACVAVKGPAVRRGNAAVRAASVNIEDEEVHENDLHPLADDDQEQDAKEEHDDDSWIDDDSCAFDREFGVHTSAAGLAHAIAFPRWRFLSDENDPSMLFYTDPYEEGMFAPKRHWTLLAEITDCSWVGQPFGRNQFVVRDRAGEEFAVWFYVKDEPMNLKPLLHSEGYTIAIRYGEKHAFMDGTSGVRLEKLSFVKGAYPHAKRATDRHQHQQREKCAFASLSLMCLCLSYRPSSDSVLPETTVLARCSHSAGAGAAACMRSLQE